MNPRVMFVPLAVAASLGMAACGGGDKKLSKSDLASKADAICNKAEKDLKAVKAPASLAQDPVAAAAYFKKILPISQKQTDDFEDLKPADDVKADWNQLVARQKQGNELLKSIHDKAEAKDPSGVKDLAKLQRIADKFDTEATAVGAKGCAA